MHKKSMFTRTAISLVFFLLLILLVISLTSAENDPAPTGGSVDGDWNVQDTRTYRDCTIEMNGNLTIQNGGDLTFLNVTLQMNCSADGERKIEVQAGGAFQIRDKDGSRNTILDRSNITAVDGGHQFIFWVNKDSKFLMENSKLSNCGYRENLGYSVNGLFIEAENVQIEGNQFRDCHYALGFNHTRGFSVVNNSFEKLWEWSSLSVWHSNEGLISNNVFEGASISITNSSLITIKDNTLMNATSATAIYLNAQNSTISRNRCVGNDGGIMLTYSPLYPITENNLIEFNSLEGSLSTGVIVSKIGKNNLFQFNHYSNNYKSISLNGFEPAGSPENNSFENEIIENSTLRAISIYYSYNNSFIDCFIRNSALDLLAYGDSQNIKFVNSTITSYDVRDTSIVFIKNRLLIQVLNSTASPLPGADILIEQDGAPVYSTSGFGGTDPETDTSGKTPQLVLTDRIINATSETGTNTTVTVRKGNWQETGIVNTSTSHTEVFHTPVIAFGNPGVTPDSGDQDTVFNFTVTLSAPAEYCRLVVGGEEFGMNKQGGGHGNGPGNESYYLEKTLASGNHTCSFAASNSLELFNSPGFSLPVSDTIAPPPVSGVTVSDLKNGTFLLSWSPSGAEDLDHYRLYYSLQNVSTTEGLVPWAQVTGTGNTTGTISGLNTGTTYYFAVTAVDAHGNENQSIWTVKGVSEPFLVEVSIESLDITPGKPEESKDVKIDFTVKNSGEAGIPELVVCLKIDGKELYNRTFTGFYVNGTLSDSFNWKAVKGEHTVEIFVIRDGKTKTRERGFRVEEEGGGGDGFIPGFGVVVVLGAIIFNLIISRKRNEY